MEPKSNIILTSVKLWFLLPLPCEINVFTTQDPSKDNTKSLQQKKNSATRLPPSKSSIFNLRAPLDGNMSRKGFQKGSFWGGRERPKNVIFAVRSCLGARMIPKSPQVSILEALLTNFAPFLSVFETFFIDLFHPYLHLMWVEGATKKQLTAHSKLNDGCDGNVLHNSVQHKNEQILMAGQGTVAGRPKANGSWIL